MWHSGLSCCNLLHLEDVKQRGPEGLKRIVKTGVPVSHTGSLDAGHVDGPQRQHATTYCSQVRPGMRPPRHIHERSLFIRDEKVCTALGAKSLVKLRGRIQSLCRQAASSVSHGMM